MRTLLLVVVLWLSGCSINMTSFPPALKEIKLEVARDWQKQCENYFFWRSPRIVAYRGGSSHELLPPTTWCQQESMAFLRDMLPHDYITDIDKRR